MNNISLFWSGLILLYTVFIYIICRNFLHSSRRREPLMCICISLFLYSGIGIGYSEVDKKFVVYYCIFLLVLSITYTVVINIKIRFVIDSMRTMKVHCMDDNMFWSKKCTKNIFKGIVYIYILLRFISLVYPVNKLSNFMFVFNSANNINNLTGANASWIGGICTWIQPFFLIGLTFICKKVRYVACFLGIDLIVILIDTGYLSRYKIIVVVIICLLLFFNGDLNNEYISMSKKLRRIIISLAITGPILLYLMMTMMEARIATGASFTVAEFIRSEIGYPLQFEKIFEMAPISNIKDFFLQLLDSFIPILPTPTYHMDLNVDFSMLYLGYGMDVSWFSIKLPSLLGESFLIFGNYFYWIHGIVIGCLTALIYKVTRENRYTKILYYHYLTCILTTGRAGYEQLSQSVWLNYIMLLIGLFIIRTYSYNRNMKAIS